MRFWFGLYFSFFCMGCLLLGAPSCSNNSLKPDPSVSPYVAGQSTQVMGGCHSPMSVGFQYCMVVQGQNLPVIDLVFTHPADYMVSDCDGNFYAMGETDDANVVGLDLVGLKESLAKRDLCFVKVESVETYRDETSQIHAINHRGWIILEAVRVGFTAIPSPSNESFCYRIGRTISGRTSLVKIDCDEKFK